MGAFVWGFSGSQAEQAFRAGADGLLDEVTGIDGGHRQQGDFFEIFHKSSRDG